MLIIVGTSGIDLRRSLRPFSLYFDFFAFIFCNPLEFPFSVSTRMNLSLSVVTCLAETNVQKMQKVPSLMLIQCIGTLAFLWWRDSASGASTSSFGKAISATPVLACSLNLVFCLLSSFTHQVEFTFSKLKEHQEGSQSPRE